MRLERGRAPLCPLPHLQISVVVEVDCLAFPGEGRRGRRLDGLQSIGDVQGVPDLGLHRLFDGCVAFLLDVDQLLLVRVEDEEGELSHFVGLLLRLVASSVQGEHYAGVSDRLAGRVEKCAEDSALTLRVEGTERWYLAESVRSLKFDSNFTFL